MRWCADTSSHRAGGATAVVEPIDAPLKLRPYGAIQICLLLLLLLLAQCKNCHNLSAWRFLKPRTDTHCSVLFCSLAVFDPRVGHTMDVLSPICPCSLSFWLTSTESPFHVLMLSIQAVLTYTDKYSNYSLVYWVDVLYTELPWIWISMDTSMDISMCG